MNIYEAMKKAIEEDKCIIEEDHRPNEYVKIKPTDGIDCCILIYCRNGEKVSSRRCWNPGARDFIREDWEVI